jgi:hypothetical protein
MDAMKAVCKMVLEDIQKKQKRGADKAPTPRPPQRATAPPQQTAAPALATADDRVAPVAATGKVQQPAPVEQAAGIQRTVVLPVEGPGAAKVALSLPMELELGTGVEAVQVTVEVNVNYLTQGAGRVLVRELANGSPTESVPEEAPEPPPPPKKRGFFARMFGG